jgi:hypothetical protein
MTFSEEGKGQTSMRLAHFVITLAVVAGLSGTARAQSSPNTQQVTTTNPATPYSEPGDHWFASAYLGSNFGSAGSTNLNNLANLDLDNGGKTSINFGGEIGYVWGGAWGAEFLANHAPSFEISDRLLQRRPSVQTYMVNALAALPIGAERKFRPFVSGGIGGVSLRSTIFTIDPSTTTVDLATLGTATSSRTEFGWDLGGGVYAFNGPWGLRGDVRYYKATTDNNLNNNTLEGLFLVRNLSGLSFWNANFGIAFRW